MPDSQPLSDPGERGTFASDLAKARADRIPVMALRPDDRFPDEMDDIVVEDVTMFRAEAMSDKTWWMACYFANGERVSFNVGIAAKPRRIAVTVGEEPGEWIDWDERRREQLAREALNGGQNV